MRETGRRHNYSYIHSPGGTFHVISFRSAVFFDRRSDYKKNRPRMRPFAHCVKSSVKLRFLDTRNWRKLQYSPGSPTQTQPQIEFASIQWLEAAINVIIIIHGVADIQREVSGWWILMSYMYTNTHHTRTDADCRLRAVSNINELLLLLFVIVITTNFNVSCSWI